MYLGNLIKSLPKKYGKIPVKGISLNSNNIKNVEIDDNKFITTIDLSINYNNELYKSIDDIYMYSNSSLSNFSDLLLTI